MTTDVQEREPQVSENRGNGIPTDPAEMIARAERILGGDIRPEDYLPVTDEIETAVHASVAELVRYQPEMIVCEVGIELVRQQFSLSYHCGGKAALVRQQQKGVIVLARTWENVMIVQKECDPETWAGFGIDFPPFWTSETEE